MATILGPQNRTQGNCDGVFLDACVLVKPAGKGTWSGEVPAGTL